MTRLSVDIYGRQGEGSEDQRAWGKEFSDHGGTTLALSTRARPRKIVRPRNGHYANAYDVWSQGARGAQKECHEGGRFLQLAREIALTHHERWDGKGYPQQLGGESIPLSGRLMAVADVYDASRCVRCYKSAMEHDKVVNIIRQERGKQFDPVVVDAFLEIEQNFLKVSQAFIDPVPAAIS